MEQMGRIANGARGNYGTCRTTKGNQHAMAGFAPPWEFLWAEGKPEWKPKREHQTRSYVQSHSHHANRSSTRKDVKPRHAPPPPDPQTPKQKTHRPYRSVSKSGVPSQKWLNCLSPPNRTTSQHKNAPFCPWLTLEGEQKFKI